MQYFSTTTQSITSSLLIGIATMLAAAILVLPQGAQAYETTAQSATKLTDNTFLFQVTYRLNFLNRETRVPILASRATEVDTTSPQVQYSLRDAAGELVTTGASTAIVMSDVAIVDKQYYLPESTAGLPKLRLGLS